MHISISNRQTDRFYDRDGNSRLLYATQKQTRPSITSLSSESQLHTICKSHSVSPDLRRVGAHELLDLLALGHESDHSSVVGLRVDFVRLFEAFVEMFGETKIEIPAADIGIARRRQHLQLALGGGERERFVICSTDIVEAQSNTFRV